MDQKPSIGRIVTYHRPENGIEVPQDVPAIITRVDDSDRGLVCLTAFPPDHAAEPHRAGYGEGEGRWTWPERV